MTRNKRNNKVGASAPTENGAGDNVKVDIETEDTPEVPEAVEADVIDEAPEAAASSEAAAEVDDEQARIEAAIAAGEAAAAEDFKADASKLAAERDELAKQLAGVQDEIDAAKAEATSATERYQRLQADWENFRKRADRERVAERERACEGLVKDLLPAIDDLERAVEHASGAAEGDEVAKQLVDGVSAVHAKIVSILEKQGVEVIDPAGDAFDPMEHQAVGRVENSEVFDETVADVYQKGYRMAGKVVRPAMVTVAYGGEKRPAEPEAGSEAQDSAEATE